MNNELVRASDVNVDEMIRIGKMLAISGYFDAKGDNNIAVAQMCTKILAGREMGYGPFASVQGIHIIQGRPSISANLMASAVKNHPHYDYRVRVNTDKECTIEFFQDGESLGASTFTADDARKAGTKNMDKFPRNMLFARAMSNGVRWFTPDVFNGNTVYVPEELGADVDSEGNVITVQPQPERIEQPQPQKAQPPTNGRPAWRNSMEAYTWAVQQGYFADSDEAKAAFLEMLKDRFGGPSIRPDQQPQAYDEWHEMVKARQPVNPFDDAEPLEH